MPNESQLQAVRRSPTIESEARLTSESAQKLDAFFADFSSSRLSHLLLDYDGTLAPLRIDRFKSRPWAGYVRDLLNRIQSQKKTRISIVTGRAANEIAPLLSSRLTCRSLGTPRRRAPLSRRPPPTATAPRSCPRTTGSSPRPAAERQPRRTLRSQAQRSGDALARCFYR